MTLELTLSGGTRPPSTLMNGYTNLRWWPEIRLDMNLQGAAADYYLLSALRDGDEQLSRAFSQYAQVLAKQFAIYLDASIGGELRHSSKHPMHGHARRAVARGEWRKERRRDGLKALERGRDLFFNGKWKSGYGGKAWGRVTDLLIKHLSGELSCELFVDQALALEHNNGCVFDKLNDYWMQNHLRSVLDDNLNEKWEGLLKYGSGWAKKMFLEWLTAEDDLVVPDYEHSRPWRNIWVEVPGEPNIGNYVKVSDTTRSLTLRGKIGRVYDMRYIGVREGVSLFDFQIRDIEDAKNRGWLRIKSLKKVVKDAKAKNGGERRYV